VLTRYAQKTCAVRADRAYVSRVISFIVPAFNEQLELPSTIAAIRVAAEKIDNGYEIIVVDDASTDTTPEIAAQAGARVVSINRRQIAAARNAGARAALGEVLFFVDADTRINHEHVVDALTALNARYSGGSARVVTDGTIPLWGRIFVKTFCAIYFASNLGAGAFLFTTRDNFEKIGRFDEQLFIGEEVYFSLALRKLGRFKILREPIITSGRKLRMYSARQVLGRSFSIIVRGKRAAQSRDRLDLWYEGKRESAKM
jgi:glycosyltransferase involved in cell wall biosynthesis